MDIVDIMTTKIEYVDADASVYDAIEKLVDKRIRSLVVRPPQGQSGGLGVITVRDIAFKVIARGIDPQAIPVSEITSKPLICVQQNATTHQIIRLMQSANISRVFVCSGDKPTGVISLLDVVRGALIEKARKGHGL